MEGHFSNFSHQPERMINRRGTLYSSKYHPNSGVLIPQENIIETTNYYISIPSKLFIKNENVLQDALPSYLKDRHLMCQL
jgi:hypothetical protein